LIESDNDERTLKQDSSQLTTRLSMPSGLYFIEPAIQMLERFFEERDVCVPRLSLVVTELLRNAVTHGNKGQPDKTVELRAEMVDPQQVRISVQDQGEGFDWWTVDLSIPDFPRRLIRRGLLLVAGCARSIEFNGRGNRVSIQMDCEPTVRTLEQVTCPAHEVHCPCKRKHKQQLGETSHENGPERGPLRLEAN
jgi:anti-sigma regulatory factor (Ser/Thr protein kinase)